MSTGKPQQIKISGAALTCGAGNNFVTAGSLSGSMQVTTTNCGGLINKTANGSGTLVWTAPAGMGKSTAKVNLKFTTSSGNVTNGTINGVVTTSGSNLAAGKAIGGSFTLNKGLRSIASGGNCSVTIPLTNFGITQLNIHT